MKTPREIAIIATPRSGTNFFCDTLGEFDELSSFFELFNPRGVFGLERCPPIYEQLSQGLGFPVADVSDPQLIEYATSNPESLLTELGNAVGRLGKTAFSYKIFPGQLKRNSLENILSGQHRHFLFIVRSRIDTYISFKKAMQVDHWVNRPTEDIKITVELDEFMEWAAGQDKWYAGCEAILRSAKRPYFAFSYEADVNVPKETLLEKQFLVLRSAGIDLPFPMQITPPRFRRQDKLVGPFKKIANGEDLKNELGKRGLLGRYALRHPLIPFPQDAD